MAERPSSSTRSEAAPLAQASTSATALTATAAPAVAESLTPTLWTPANPHGVVDPDWLRPHPANCTSTIIARARQDRKALGVATEMGLDDEACEMHDSDKVGASCVGDLTRSSNHKIINPFPEGQYLVLMVHKGVAHFSYSTRADKLKEIAAANNVCCAPRPVPLHSDPHQLD